MSLEHKYTLICEHARPEVGGKWSLIGIFLNGIGTPQIPFPLPMLTFFQVFHVPEAAAPLKFTAKLSELATGTVLAQAQGGGIQPLVPGPLVLPVGLPNLQFKAFGTYTWSLEVPGEPEPFVTQFNVAHVPMQVRFGPGGPIGSV